METSVFKYPKTDKRARRLTVVWFIMAAGLIALTWYLWGEGGYVVAWAVSLIVALLALCALSIPRNITVNEAALEIRCVVEITRVQIPNLRSIRKVDKAEMKKIFPITAGHGFFGYYGYYLDRRNGEPVKLYCSEWDNFVEITDIFEKRIYVNCEDIDGLIDAVRRASTYYIGPTK